jgi:hypothetical protein
MPIGSAYGPACNSPIIRSFISLGQVASFPSIDVPSSEANALIDFYNATDGDNWTTNTGWCTDTTVGNWDGVTVEDGHVTILTLSNNSLSDTTNISFLGLTYLANIDLSDNSLSEISCNLILQALDAYGVYSGTLDLSGNTGTDYGTESSPSDTALAVVSLLEKDWTLTVTGDVPSWVLDMVELTVGRDDINLDTSDTAMFFHNTEDLSYLAAESDGTSNYLIEFVDAEGNTARGYAGSVGGGLEFEDQGAGETNLLAGWDFTSSGWDPSFVTVIDSNTYQLDSDRTGGGIRFGRGYLLEDGKLYYGEVEGTTTDIGEIYTSPAIGSSASYFRLAENGIPLNVSAVYQDSYWDGSVYIAIEDSVGSTQITITKLGVYKYIDVPSTGLHLVTTQNGSTRGLASKDTDFDARRIEKVRFLDPNL